MTRAEKVTPAPVDPVAAPAASEGEAEMERYGIERIPVDYFHVGGFRYTSLREAVAHARRMDATAGAQP